MYRRQLRFDDAVAVYERAAQYDPGNSKLFFDLATTCLWAGRNDKVQAPLERALALNPTNEGAAAVLGQFLFMQRGDVEGARRVLSGRGPGAQITLADTYWPTRDYEKAIRLIEELPEDSAAFGPFEGLRTNCSDFYLHSAGHDQRARPLLEPARDRRSALLADKTLSAWAFAVNSMGLARIELALGNRDAAVQVAERGAQSDAMTRDTIQREYYRSFLAEIYAGAGRKDEAIALISEFLNARSGFAGITPSCCASLRAGTRSAMTRAFRPCSRNTRPSCACARLGFSAGAARFQRFLPDPNRRLANSSRTQQRSEVLAGKSTISTMS